MASQQPLNKFVDFILGEKVCNIQVPSVQAKGISE
jgi:hypothetical protein